MGGALFPASERHTQSQCQERKRAAVMAHNTKPECNGPGERRMSPSMVLHLTLSQFKRRESWRKYREFTHFRFFCHSSFQCGSINVALIKLS